VELIRSGKAPEVVRRKGAEGTLPLPAEDRIEILTLLAVASEADLREKALETLRRWDRAEVRRVMASPQTAPDVLRFAAEHLLAGHEELREILLWNPSLPAPSLDLLQPKPAPEPVAAEAANEPPSPPQPEPLPPPPAPEAAQEPPSKPAPASEPAAEEVTVEMLAKLAAGEKLEGEIGTHVQAPPEATKRDDELTEKERETLIQKLNRMSVVEKIKAALTGNLETRSILIRDANKMISRAVLQSPKISDTEMEGYAAAKNVSEEVLRLIAMNRKFMKSYVVMRALINNPRAPIDITMPLIGRLNDRDLKGVSLNRNVPEVIRTMAIKAIKQKEEAAKPKLPTKH
jgi:hypothetical protein